MQIKTNDNTLLNVNKVGHGPILILIPGANGTGDIFYTTAETLKNNFTVITYDRRGYGKTVVPTPLPANASDPDSNYRIDKDVDDIFALADTFSPNEPVYLMGSSSGSIVAEKAFSKNPNHFVKVSIHESPLATVIDDGGQFKKESAQIVQKVLDGNFGAISDLFVDQMHIQPLDAKMMGLATDSKPDPAKMKSILFWLKYESAQYTSQVIDWNIFKNNSEKVILLNGTDSTGFFPQTVNQAISKKIDVPITMISGGHLGYAQKPEKFADTLTDALLK
ncbi:alpha/beta hydrolase [Loigolactobacillus backii]|uniref:alpha/beta hydrolase n=1 Tax=Loigolactobacillus TaxID=2767889 RepID=UPI0007F062B7|nr:MULTISPECIES: alpha/beta fold hydrolase [Loigolactobacillus]ANK60578.1 alpha/beta hydrolase [Loigolactobacillus backii]ANK65531.1 alpha/beta hydrolase [Loigolactobacillus backii]ANK68002.1 alpha/beta hydrolase [Loigolactobacillus backii]OLF69524.1 alpha/beta hydrolase [Loigolactobacillus backii]PIO86776.1 alpha/beta hydrolase [Loigolactobacillus backii]